MSRNFHFAEDEFYHIYNRGTDKRVIYSDTDDYKRFVLLLYLSNTDTRLSITNALMWGDKRLYDLYGEDRGETLVEIGAYCLMPNHFHILIREKHEGGISLFMKKLSNAYTAYFNNKYDRTGALFQGRFKAKHVNEDPYLRYLFAYIHLNPLSIVNPEWKEKGIQDKESAVIYLERYPYSSYAEYRGVKRREGKILEVGEYPPYFQTPKDFDSYLRDWLTYHDHHE